MKSLILTFLLTLALTLVTSPLAASDHYGPTIPALPKDGELYHADVLDCNPDDFEADDPYFYLALGYIWEGETPMHAVIFYLNTDIKENSFANPTAVFYGSDEEPAIFVRVATTVERFDGFEDFIAKYPFGICSIPRPQEEI